MTGRDAFEGFFLGRCRVIVLALEKQRQGVIYAQ